ncbi:MAG: PKD domain-containing protein [Thermoplasmata archaeon]
MKGRIAVVLMSAAMLILVSAPTATGGTHEIVKGKGGPKMSAVTWDYVPPDYGYWSCDIVNNGLRWLDITVYDNTADGLEEIMHQRIRFAAYDAYPHGDVSSERVRMSPAHRYVITAIPNGPDGSYCMLEDRFFVLMPPVAMFTFEIDGLTVHCDATSSYDADGYIVSYDWTFGDGGAASGSIVDHTYEGIGWWKISLVVKDNDGLSDSTESLIHIRDLPPTASFTVIIDGLTVIADASASWDDFGIVKYLWYWGDGSASTGVTATHTYGDAIQSASRVPCSTSAMESGSVVQDIGVFQIFGFTYDQEGRPLAGCMMTISNTRTGDVLNTVSDEFGFYLAYGWDMPSGILNGDVIEVTAKTGEAIGWNEGVVDLESGLLWIDVVLNPVQVGGIRSYTITLTVTDTSGQMNVMTMEIAIAPLPVASFTYVVSGSTVYVDASGSSAEAGIAYYTWDWGDGSPLETTTSPTASHTYGASSLTLSAVGRTSAWHDGATGRYLQTEKDGGFYDEGYLITLVVTDELGQTGEVSEWVSIAPE